MEEMYNAIAFTSSSSSAGGADHRSPDDISVFLNQFLHRSSLYSTASPQTAPFSASPAAPSSVPPENHPRGGSWAFCSSGNVRGNTTSFSVSENETDEYDCESEEGLEALVEEAPAKSAAARSSSKRSRAAEVHNLSEKRRRSRINEKMKALQNLIPNSNKTDKASMLDEAIEYLKQLQLQVQMLSMRNRVSLNPVCLPIQRSQFSGIFPEENRSQPMSIIESVLLNPGNAEQTLYDLPNQCTVSSRLPLPNMSTLLNPETSLGIDSSVRPQFNPFPLPDSSGEIGSFSSKNGEYGVVLPASLQGTWAGRSDEIKMEKHQIHSLF